MHHDIPIWKLGLAVTFRVFGYSARCRCRFNFQSFCHRESVLFIAKELYATTLVVHLFFLDCWQSKRYLLSREFSA